jgi:hypothetical protein
VLIGSLGRSSVYVVEIPWQAYNERYSPVDS